MKKNDAKTINNKNAAAIKKKVVEAPKEKQKSKPVKSINKVNAIDGKHKTQKKTKSDIIITKKPILSNKKRQKVKNVIVISDTHCGDRMGLMPPKVTLDEGNVVVQSKMQAEVWKMWLYFWRVWVPKVTKGEDFVIVVNGDIVDGVHHGSTTTVTGNMKDQRSIAVQCMKLPLSNPKCVGLYMIRGTEVHVGHSGEDEETIAETLKAIPDENGNHSRYELWLEFGKKKELIHFTHHVGTTSSAAYESTAVYKELVEAFNEAGRWQDKPPTICVRSHRHRVLEVRIPTDSGYGISLVTPAWQLRTPFTFRIAMGRSGTPQVGGYLIRDGEEDGLYTRFKVWRVQRTKTEIL